MRGHTWLEPQHLHPGSYLLVHLPLSQPWGEGPGAREGGPMWPGPRASWQQTHWLPCKPRFFKYPFHISLGQVVLEEMDLHCLQMVGPFWFLKSLYTRVCSGNWRIEIHWHSPFPSCSELISLKKALALPHFWVVFLLSSVCVWAFSSQTASWEAYERIYFASVFIWNLFK